MKKYNNILFVLIFFMAGRAFCSDAGFYYVVQPGDILSQVLKNMKLKAPLYGAHGAVRQVTQLNESLKSTFGNRILPGERLYIPKKIISNFSDTKIKPYTKNLIVNASEQIDEQVSKQKLSVPVQVQRGGETLNFVFDINLNLNTTNGVITPITSTRDSHEDTVNRTITTVDSGRGDALNVVSKNKKKSITIFGGVDLYNMYSVVTADNNQGGRATLGSEPGYQVDGLLGLRISTNFSLASFFRMRAMQYKRPSGTPMTVEDSFFWTVGGELQYGRQKYYHLFIRGLLTKSLNVTSTLSQINLTSIARPVIEAGIFSEILSQRLWLEGSGEYHLPVSDAGVSLKDAYGLSLIAKYKFKKNYDWGTQLKVRYLSSENNYSLQSELNYGMGVYFAW